MEPSQIAVEMRGISKRFGSVQALENVDLRVARGETHALVGENGAGKTTLMRILYGALRPDSGEIEVQGKAVRFHSASEAIAAGIGMVSQHYSIIPELTCLQNLMLGAEPSWVLDNRAAAQRAEELARSMDFRFDWHEPAQHLSPAGAQKLEILKLLWRNAQIMILDEPTAMLSPADSDALFLSLKKLTDQGATVLLVTHRLPEVMAHCTRATVLRGGERVAETASCDVSPAQLAELIVGHAVEAPPQIGNVKPGERVLELRGLRAKGQRGDEALKGVDLELRQGELLGIAGVDGSGQRELFWTLAGVLSPSAGKVEILGVDGANLSSRDRMRMGVRLIPEDRHDEGVVEEWPLEANVAIGLQRLPELSRKGWMRPAAQAKLAQSAADRFRTRHGGVRMPMKSLSGGNQQRFIAARALEVRPKIILAFQPARGLDIEATRQVYRALREECAMGAAALVVSFDLDELLENCDRIVAMCSGKVFEPPPELARDRGAIGRLMVAAE